jgi:hypothetical protein
MKYRYVIFGVLMAGLALFGSCVSTPAVDYGDDEEIIAQMPRDPVVANTARSWGGDELAKFTYDYEHEGVTGLKVEQDYGATIWSYNYSGLPPNSKVQIDIDVWVDCLENSSWTELFWGPGHYVPEQKVWDELGDEHKWAFFGKNGYKWKMDTNGRDDEIRSLGNGTDGWEHVRAFDQADEKGNFFFAIQTGHWDMFPVFVEGYFANLRIKPVN